MYDPTKVRLLGFDVFGTVVDWRGSVTRHVDRFFAGSGVAIDGAAFATHWRSLYQPAMEPVRTGNRPYEKLNVLNFENLKLTLAHYGIESDRFDEDSLLELNRSWERLDPWPDSVEAVDRLKRRFVVATISNGHTAGMLWLSKYADLHWDAILGADVARNFKPRPEVYLMSAEAAGLDVGQTAMVAAHNDDLGAAAEAGMRTFFVLRPTEHGPGQTTDLGAESDWDVVADSLADLADQLGC